jgi:hypothetical protein
VVKTSVCAAPAQGARLRSGDRLTGSLALGRMLPSGRFKAEPLWESMGSLAPGRWQRFQHLRNSSRHGGCLGECLRTCPIHGAPFTAAWMLPLSDLGSGGPERAADFIRLEHGGG